MAARPARTTPIRPDTEDENRAGLSATGVMFLPGHRLRVDTASSSHPGWDHNPNTGRSAYGFTHTSVAPQRIFQDLDRPGPITLTVVD
jgi:predicted acyl esterase